MTDATTGRLLAVAGGGLDVVAVSGPVDPMSAVGSSVRATGARGYVLSSGQPAALMPQSTDPANAGAGGYLGVPTSLLAAPCGDRVIVAVLELAEKAGGAPFSFDDIEIAAALAAVAGAAVAEDGDRPIEVISPGEVAIELSRLATVDPRRYLDTARLIESLLGQGS